MDGDVVAASAPNPLASRSPGCCCCCCCTHAAPCGGTGLFSARPLLDVLALLVRAWPCIRDRFLVAVPDVELDRAGRFER